LQSHSFGVFDGKAFAGDFGSFLNAPEDSGLREYGFLFGRYPLIWIAVRGANGSCSRLFLLVYGVRTLVTIFMSNDATAVVLTPAILTAVRKAVVVGLVGAVQVYAGLTLVNKVEPGRSSALPLLPHSSPHC
jgi:hypothetical protein